VPAPSALPAALQGCVFTRREATSHGLTDKHLRGSRIVAVMAGLYRYRDHDPGEDELALAVRRLLPDGVALSHTSALAWYGVQLGPAVPLHFATNRPIRVKRPEVRVHRFAGELLARVVRGMPILDPSRTFIDCGTVLSYPRMLAAGDWLCAQGFTDPASLAEACAASHLDGVQRARAVARWIRPGAESVRESMTRWHLVSRGLPEPEINIDILDRHGTFLARGDLPYPRYKVLVEYDGWYHERDAIQRDRDVLRREALDRAGWSVVVITSSDSGERIAFRTFAALAARGYRGNPPHFPRIGP
jgi:very-short-patch-repair endonuclease